MKLRVWLDDDLVDRTPPGPDWVHVTNVDAVVKLCELATVVELSLDHDLGDAELHGRGIDVIDWLAEQHAVGGRNLWPREGISLHDRDARGRGQMARAIRRAAQRCGVEVTETRPGGRPHFDFGS